MSKKSEEMDDFSEEYELIDRYLSEEMSKEEKEAFEIKLNKSPKIQEMVRDVKLIKLSVRTIEREKILHQIKAVAESKSHEETPTIQRQIGGQNIKWLSIAASILLIFTVGALFYYLNSDGQSTSLQAYIPFADYNPAPIRGKSENLTLLKNGWKMYQNKKYEECLEEISNITDSFQSIAETNFLKGQCLIALNRYSEAIEPLKKSSKSNFRYQEDAMWYLGLTYLELDKVDIAKEVLSKIEGKKYPVEELLKGL